MDTARLRAIELFSDLGDDALHEIAPKFQEVFVGPTASLAKAGEFGYHFFVVEEGTAEVFVGGTLVTTLGPGDFFGEIALEEGERRTADVIATTKMQLLSMLIWDFQEFHDAHPSIGAKIDAMREERRNRA
jgi:cAMP-dependent protein kinase regulator/CRP/FNR family cyclic AMP-dependent transcriptional regulator/cGMP-dependent protein kinase 2